MADEKNVMSDENGNVDAKAAKKAAKEAKKAEKLQKEQEKRRKKNGTGRQGPGIH